MFGERGERHVANARAQNRYVITQAHLLYDVGDTRRTLTNREEVGETGPIRQRRMKKSWQTSGEPRRGARPIACRPPHDSTPGTPGGGRVLVVEDDAHIRDLVVLHLQLEGLTAVAAGDGADGLRLAKADPFDLLILDVMLPRARRRHGVPRRATRVA